MSVIISDNVSSVKFTFSNGEVILMDKDKISMKEQGFIRTHVYISNGEGFVNTSNTEVLKLHYTEVASPSLASNAELITLILGYKVSSGAIMGSVQITDGTKSVTLEPNGSLPVTLQDQGTPSVITKFSILEQATTITADVAIDDYTFTVASPTGISVGKYLSVFDPIGVRFSNYNVIGIVGSVVTVDSPIDFAYPSGSYMDVQESNLAVNGSVTPVVSGVRNNAGSTPPPGIELTIDVTRLIFHIITVSAVDLTLFGDIAALTNGLYCRRRDGEYFSIFNVKTNGEIASIMYDHEIHTAAPHGIDGWVSRITFAGQNKMGVTQRLAINEDLEIIIQDNLSAITLFEIIAEGSVVEP